MSSFNLFDINQTNKATAMGNTVHAGDCGTGATLNTDKTQCVMVACPVDEYLAANGKCTTLKADKPASQAELWNAATANAPYKTVYGCAEKLQENAKDVFSKFVDPSECHSALTDDCFLAASKSTLDLYANTFADPVCSSVAKAVGPMLIARYMQRPGEQTQDPHTTVKPPVPNVPLAQCDEFHNKCLLSDNTVLQDGLSIDNSYHTTLDTTPQSNISNSFKATITNGACKVMEANEHCGGLQIDINSSLHAGFDSSTVATLFGKVSDGKGNTGNKESIVQQSACCYAINA